MTTPTTETGALYLVAQIREALGDNGRRMQDELLDHCRHLAKLEGRQVLPYCPRCCRIAPADIHTCTPTPEWRAMETRIADLEARLALSEEARNHAISHLDARGDTLGHLNTL